MVAQAAILLLYLFSLCCSPVSGHFIHWAGRLTSGRTVTEPISRTVSSLGSFSSEFRPLLARPRPSLQSPGLFTLTWT